MNGTRDKSARAKILTISMKTVVDSLWQNKPHSTTGGRTLVVRTRIASFHLCLCSEGAVIAAPVNSYVGVKGGGYT